MKEKVDALTSGELRNRYGSFYDASSKVHINSGRVPPTLHSLIPYAAIWGISDDLERENLVESAPRVAREDLIRLVDAFQDELDEWLAGPEADEGNPSDEYVAFSAMRMARDFI